METGELIAALREAEAVRFGEFELSSGGTSSYYVDKYAFETDPRCLGPIAQALAERVHDETLAGVALGAVPLATAASLESGRPYVIVRKTAKDYGTGNRIEGALPEDGEVVVVEDVATTGRSAADAVEALRAAGATVRRVLAVVDRQEGAAATLADVDAGLEALVTASELLDDAESHDAGD